jgi:tRNA-dihydrouridine synthase B
MNRLPYSIKNVSHPLYLAPMAGYSDVAFRALCKTRGADVMVSEFVMCNAALEAGGDSRIWKMLSFPDSQRPVGLQLFGADPFLMSQAARKIEDLMHPDFIDINCGCPAPKVVCQNAGSALMKDLPLMAAIVREVVRAVTETPVTVKMRTGWSSGRIVAVEAAKMMESEGAAAIAVHGRTREQGYSGDADWNLIGEVAHAVKIPVIGNGSTGGGYPTDIIIKSGVAGVMVGRAALGNPWIFTRLRAELDGKPTPEEPSYAERLQTMLEYAERMVASGEEFTHIRPKLKPFTQGIPGARKLRGEIDHMKTLPELEAALKVFQYHDPAETD